MKHWVTDNLNELAIMLGLASSLIAINPYLAALMIPAVPVYTFLWQKLVGEPFREECERQNRPGGEQGVPNTSWIRIRNAMDNPAELYKIGLSKLLDRLTNWIGDLEIYNGNKSSWFARHLGCHPFSWMAYHRCLFLAFIYPVGGFFIAWVVSGNSDWAGVEVLPASPVWFRISMMALVCAMPLIMYVDYIQSRPSSSFFALFAIAIAYLVASALLMVFVLSVLSAGILTTATAIAVAIIVALVFAVISYKALLSKEDLNLSDSMQPVFVGFTTFFGLLVVSFCFLMPDTSSRQLVLFLGALPLANALIDSISLGISRGLLHAVAHRKHHPGLGIVLALLDGVLALLLLGIMAVWGLVVAAALNWACYLGGKSPIVPLPELLVEMSARPWAPEHIWIWFMLLSTLIPTLIHAAFASASWLTWITSETLKDWADNLIDHHKRFFLRTYLFLIGPLAFLVPIVVLSLLFYLATSHTELFGKTLLALANTVVSAIDAPQVITNP
ncbi:MAG: hypothetical protein AAF558_15000 [Verrucomicrobiota bacterium]